MKTTRRGFLIGAGALIAAPAIVRATTIMPVRNRLLTGFDQPGFCRDEAYYLAHMDDVGLDRIIRDTISRRFNFYQALAMKDEYERNRMQTSIELRTRRWMKELTS